MPAQSYAFLSFNRGLISRLGLARIDIDRVRVSASEMRNWVPRVLGSMMIRPGLEYIGTTYAGETRLVPFIFSSTDTALLEFTPSNLRVWDDDALITRPAVTTAISNPDFDDGITGDFVTNGDFNTDLSSWTQPDAPNVVTLVDLGNTGLSARFPSASQIPSLRQQVTPSTTGQHRLNFQVRATHPATIWEVTIGRSATSSPPASEMKYFAFLANVTPGSWGAFNIDFNVNVADPFFITFRRTDNLFSESGYIDDVICGQVASLTSSWTDVSDAGVTASTQSSPSQLILTGTGTASEAREQAVTVPAASQNVEHALRVVITRGPVTFQVGSTSGGSDYFARSELEAGTHSLTFTPTGDTFFVRFSNRLKRQVLVDKCDIESAGAMVLPAPYTSSDLDLIRYDQSGDVVFIACDGYTQRRVERRTPTSWSIVQYLANDGPFKLQNVSTTTLTPAALSGNTTLTASAALFKESHAPSTNNAGALFRVTSIGQRVTQTSIQANNVFTNSIRITGVTTSRPFTVIRTFSVGASATVSLQRSLETSTGPWTTVETYTATGTKNFDDGLDNQIAWYRLGVTTYASGSISLELNYSGGSIDGLCRVTSYTSATVVNVEVIEDFGATTATDNWAEGIWSDASGWPSAVSFHEGRLGWAGKDRILLSVSDAFNSFDETTEGDSGPISRTIGQGPVDTFNWMRSGQRLLLGGQGAEWSARSSSFDEPLTPTNFNLKAPSTQGSSTVDAVKVDDKVIFVQKSGTRVFELDFANDPSALDYKSIDLTELVPEVGEPSIVRTAVQRQPDTRMHFVRSDGLAAVLLFDKPENVLCWFEVETSGASGLIEDVCVLPGTSVEDQVYYVVQRQLPGGTEVITNGTFDTDISGWTDISTGPAAFIVWASASQSMGIQSTSLSNIGKGTQSFTVINGSRYTLTFDVGQSQAGGGYVRVGTASDGSNVLANQTIEPFNSYSFNFTASGTTQWVTFEQFYSVSGNVRGMTIDNVSVILQEGAVRYIEKWALESEAKGQLVNKIADSFLEYSGTATTTITGLDHIEGLQVQVWADGEDVTDDLAGPPTAVQNTGWRNFNSFSSVSRSGNASWTSLTNAGSSDNLYATVTLGSSQVANYFRAQDMAGDSIPTTATIVGIQIQLEGNQDGGKTIDFDDVRLTKDGTTLVGDNKFDEAIEGAYQPFPVYGTVNFVRPPFDPPGNDRYNAWPAGTSTWETDDLWGTTWTPTEINSQNFGIHIGVTETGLEQVTASIDHIQVRVFYTLPSANPDVVAGGNIYLGAAASNVIVGLPYTARWKSGKLALAASLGVPLTKRKRIHGIGLILADTHTNGLFFGPDFNTLNRLPLVRNGKVITAESVIADIDDGIVLFPGEWTTDARLCLEARSPKPCTVLACVVDTELHEQR